MPNKRLLFAALLIFLLPLVWAEQGGIDLARQVRVYIYRPSVFADRLLGQGLPADLSAIQSTLWYLRMDPSVRSLAGMDGLARFVREHQVPGLDFSGHRSLINQDLATLFPAAPAHPFRLLKLQGTQTDDRSLPVISHLVDLQVLMLNEHVTDKGMEWLRPLKQLRVLVVPGFFVTDNSMAILAQLPRLERLSLRGTQMTDAALSGLREMPLRQLDLGSRITDKGLKLITRLSMLEHLNLHDAQVTGAGLATLAALPRIHTLFLGPSIHDNDLAELRKFPHLTRLDLTGARISDAGMATISQLAQVEELALTDTEITGQALDALSQLPKLRYLEISGTAVTPDAFKGLHAFPSLQVISFSSPARLKAADVKPLGRVAQLHSVIINGRPLGRDLVRYLQREAAQRSWLEEGFLPIAEAAEATERDLEKVLEIASAPAEKNHAPLHGLELIHDSESSLNEVIPAPNLINVDNQQDTEKNFLGEITVGATAPGKKHK